MKRSELVRRLAKVHGFSDPRADLEQVMTPPEAAATLLEAALQRGDLEGRSVLDLGCGTGILAVGAALLGAGEVEGVDVDPGAVAVAQRNASDCAGANVTFRTGDVADAGRSVDTVLMNPPFGAQRAHADRSFWTTALGSARRAVYAFALADSRTFIEQRAVEHFARIESTEPVRWDLPATFPHHRKRRVEIAVDLWVLSVGRSSDDRNRDL